MSQLDPNRSSSDPQLWSLQQQQGGSWTITLRDTDGQPYTGFSGGETLTGSVRLGQNFPILFPLQPTWLAASAGTITATVPAASTTGLDIGRYLVECHTGSQGLYQGFLEITYGLGAQTAGTTYCAFSDMLDRAPWIEKLQRPTDLAGFARQRALARKWFEDLLHRHYKGGTGIISDYYFVPGIDFGWGRQGILWRDGRRMWDFQGYLDNNGLSVTDQVIDACACYAIALVCDRQITPGKDDTGYDSAAKKYFAKAEGIASLITAEIDYNGDGIPDIVVRLGVCDTLEG